MVLCTALLVGQGVPASRRRPGVPARFSETGTGKLRGKIFSFIIYASVSNYTRHANSSTPQSSHLHFSYTSYCSV